MPYSHPLFDRLAAAIESRPGRPAMLAGTPAQAAVAIALRVGGAGSPELLLIQRAEREGDPWSGQIALPGGRRSAEDASLQETAMRETLEETGVDLTRSATVLGALDALHPRTPTLPSIVVSPFVFVLQAPVELHASDEVAEAFWVPLSMFDEPSVARESTVSTRGAEWRVPSYVLGRHVVWGLTERILGNLLQLME